MIKKKMYKYLGRNGNITTPVLLDGIEHIPMYYLVADKDRLLTKDGESFKMDAAPELTGANRTFVPLRVIAEAFGMDVTWSAQQSCVVIVPSDSPWNEQNKTEQKLLQDALLIMSPLIRDLR